MQSHRYRCPAHLTPCCRVNPESFHFGRPTSKMLTYARWGGFIEVIVVAGEDFVQNISLDLWVVRGGRGRCQGHRQAGGEENEDCGYIHTVGCHGDAVCPRGRRPACRFGYYFVVVLSTVDGTYNASGESAAAVEYWWISRCFDESGWSVTQRNIWIGDASDDGRGSATTE